jgi:phage tail sheath protein FI
MATTYKTPGVYVEEIPKLPPSVAQVETAIPAFIGYTEKAEKNGTDIKNVPTRISSLVEFEAYYGRGYVLEPGDIKVLLDEANNFAVKKVSFMKKVFYLYDAMRLFFDNGGGDCYIVSVDFYKTVAFNVAELTSETALTDGLKLLEKYDEPTIIVIPDAVSLAEAQFYALQQAAIAQCAKLQDRVAVLDLRENKETWQDAVSKFRNNIGISNLKYSGAYTPWLYTSYSRTIDYRLIRNVTAAPAVEVVRNAADTANIDLFNVTTDSTLNTLVTNINNATDDLLTIEADYTTLRTDGATVYGTLNDRYNKLKSDVLVASEANTMAEFTELMNFVRSIADVIPHWRITGDAKKFKNQDLTNALDAAAKDGINGLRKHLKDLIAFEKNADVQALSGGLHPYATAYNDFPLADANSWLGVNDITVDTLPDGIVPLAPAVPIGPTTTPAEQRAAVLRALTILEPYFKGLTAFFDTLLSSARTFKGLAQDALYNTHPVVGGIIKAIIKLISSMPPSSTIAGIFARVDNARGVWKAPANESLNSVSGPTVQITADEQANLNVDAVAGKSINAIRTFTGKGTLVWGARTLAGNDNEWRYMSVRRFFNMVEESSKKATEPFVFESNDASTWVKVQGMIENFLTTLWRQGALQGAKPEHAFYVAVGLGKTMTALDILEGRMIVEIGMAVVRPAEFIILRFSHKMAES